jgi:P2-related tail formation protein
VRRIVIRSGDIEFEIESFDAATATVTKLVLGIKSAFVATVNSEKLPNGKVRGSITVRVPPDQLDALVLDLRRELGKGGELKGVKLTSQDVTKMYTDLESRLKAARTMEQRLLQIIKEGKGEIKQLLEAEKELGVWRTKIEECEGEIRYYSNLAAFSTLTISLTEREIRAAAAFTERERVQAGVEVEDVDKAYQQLLAAVLEAKGRVTKSEVKQLTAGQFNAVFQFEVAPDASGPLRDRLRMLGRVARLEIDRTTQAESGTLPSDAKTKRGDTVFLVQLYNLANVAARETAALQVSVADVAAAYQALRDVVAKVAGRVLVAHLNEQDRQNVTAQFDFEVRRADEAAIRAALAAAGDVFSRQVTRAAEGDGVTDTKVRYKVALLSADRLSPRETATLQVAVTDVAAAYQALRDVVAKVAGRVLVAQLNEQDRKNVTAQFDFEVRRADEGAVRTAVEAAGDVLSRQVTRAAEGDGVTDTKVLYKLALLPAGRLPPRETVTLSVEVGDVDKEVTLLAAQVAEAKGRQVDAKLDRDAGGRATARLVFEVPLAAAAGLVERLKGTGTVRAAQSARDPQATEGKYATARINVTLTNVESLVPDDAGLWAKVRRGLSISASVLLTSVTWVVFGLCVVLPWAVIGFGGYRIFLRATRPTPTAAPAPAEPAPDAPPPA